MTDTQTTEIEPSVLSRHAVRQSERSPISQKNQQMLATLTKGFNLIHWASNVPSKHETLTQCWFNVGPPSKTVGEGGPTLNQHWVNVSFLLGTPSIFSGDESNRKWTNSIVLLWTVVLSTSSCMISWTLYPNAIFIAFKHYTEHPCSHALIIFVWYSLFTYYIMATFVWKGRICHFIN